MAKNFEELQIWKTAHKITLQIYEITFKWPNEEIFGLTSQTRRASVSVELNIAEGHSRYFDKELIRFLYNARGSAQEVRNCLIIAKDIEYFNLTDEQFNKLDEEIIGLVKQINGFISYTKNKSNSLVN